MTETGRIIRLDKKEGEVFADILSLELKYLVNGHDDNTGRVPGKKRTAKLGLLKEILKKWDATQPKIPGSNHINLDAVTGCEITLTGKEIKYCGQQLRQYRDRIRKELSAAAAPYTGAYAAMDDRATLIDGILERF